MSATKTERETKGRALAFGFLVAVFMAACVLLAAKPAHAATTFTVNATADKVDDRIGDGTCATHPLQVGIRPECTLRAAIQEANATSGADEIVVPAGTYELTITGTSEDSSATGDLDIRDGVTITGSGARQTIIDGGGVDRVLHTPIVGLTATPFTVNISGVKITGGFVSGSSGGGIGHFARGATLNLTESTVSGNVAVQGGGIQNGGGQGFGETMVIKRSTISGNRAPNGQGGGIQNTENLTIENTTISGNESTFAGGIMQNDGTLRITDSTIAFNTAQQPGGGISVNGPGDDVTINNMIIANNKAVGFPASNNCGEPLTSEGNNLENGTSCGFDSFGDLNADPKLGPLKNNGGPTDTHALLGGSPAMDAGGIPVPATDQRGVPRPQRTANDIGAFERVNSAPVARNDTYNAREDTTLRVPARGVLRNDSDADGDALRAALVSGPRHGKLSLRPNGAFTYKPKKNFSGTVKFVYRASDAHGGMDTATVTLRIKARPG